MAGVGPAVIEHVLAIGMMLAIGRNRRQQPSALDMHEVLGGPTGAFPQTATELQRGKKRVAQERLRLRQQGIPLLGRQFGKARNDMQRHAGPQEDTK